MRDYFNPDATYPEKYFSSGAFGCIGVSSSLLQKSWRSMMIGLS
jgi:hypothetical protein